MDRAEVEARVKKVVADVLKVDEADIKPESYFVNDLGGDSVAGYELIAGFEEEFDIEMDEEAALQVTSVGAAVDFIAEYLE